LLHFGSLLLIGCLEYNLCDDLIQDVVTFW
jgi:hypothetical protein